MDKELADKLENEWCRNHKLRIFTPHILLIFAVVTAIVLNEKGWIPFLPFVVAFAGIYWLNLRDMKKYVDKNGM